MTVKFYYVWLLSFLSNSASEATVLVSLTVLLLIEALSGDVATAAVFFRFVP